MIIGQTVFAGTYYSPWFPRRGDAAVFAGEVIAATGSMMLNVEHKNSEDADSAAAVLGSAIISSGVGTVSVTGMKELVRFKYFVGTSGNWVHFRVLPPAWRLNGA